MDATDVRRKNDLPVDPEKLLSYSWNLTLAYQQLVEKYRKLLGSQFGKSSEKLASQADLDALQLEMDGLLEPDQSARLRKGHRSPDTEGEIHEGMVGQRQKP